MEGLPFSYEDCSCKGGLEKVDGSSRCWFDDTGLERRWIFIGTFRQDNDLTATMRNRDLSRKKQVCRQFESMVRYSHEKKITTMSRVESRNCNRATGEKLLFIPREISKAFQQSTCLSFLLLASCAVTHNVPSAGTVTSPPAGHPNIRIPTPITARIPQPSRLHNAQTGYGLPSNLQITDVEESLRGGRATGPWSLPHTSIYRVFKKE